MSIVIEEAVQLDSARVAELEQVAREVRTSIVKTTNHAGAGHTGGSLSETDILVALYFEIMNIDPENPQDKNRDRFILSKGHCSPGYYCTLARRGFFPEEVLKTFDSIDSILQGHPDMRKTPGVDMSTGSLGQGISVGIGMALGGKANGQNYHTYVLVGCGEVQEGQIWEAAMYGGNHNVPNLTVIVDYNKVQLSESMKNVLSSHPLLEKWEAFGWEVLECDGHNMEEVVNTLQRSKAIKDKPVVIIAHTVKGKGVSYMENRWEWHGKPPNDEELKIAIKEINEQ